MAKKNSARMETLAEWTPSVHLDVKALADLKDLSVGDKVTIILQGKVSSLEQREGYDDASKVKGSLCLKDYEMKITGPDEWSEMAEDDDD